MSAPGLIVAAPGSGSGKTAVTLALLAALRRQDLALAAFKVGPDYIDPAFHARVIGRPSVNLDSWAMRIETLAGLSDRIGEGVDLVVGEGVMGLFDGAADASGSTADLASLLDLPVILVVDASGMGASAAVVVEGFARHRDDVEVAGVIFNRVGSEAHAQLLRRAADDRFAMPVLGCLPRDSRLVLPERHLGLVQAASCRRSTDSSKALPRSRSNTSTSTAFGAWRGPSASGSTVRPPGRSAPSANGSRSPPMSPSPSPIRRRSKDGGSPAPRCCRSRPWPIRRPIGMRMRSFCRAATPSSTLARSPPTGRFSTG
jgi:dethiobiotin synthetase